MLETEKLHFHISVRNLVEFVFKSGDIDDRFGGNDPVISMREGQRIHKMIQRNQASGYVPEVMLKTLVKFDEYEVEVEGRADGVIYDNDDEKPTLVDEIKGMYIDLDTIEEPIPVHIAQAKCYGYILCSLNNLSSITIRITYCNLDTDEIKKIERDYTFDELIDFWNEIWGEYKRWADFSYHWTINRNQMIKNMSFPFEYRDGQRKLVGEIYKVIKESETLFVEAPTGAGKTISTLYPSVQALGRGLLEKIFYLTSKTITKTVALNTFEIFRDNATRLKAIALTAKDRICMLEERSCNPDDCLYAKGHFDRVNDAVYDLLTSEDIYSEDIIKEYAIKHQVCPFEFSLDLALWCDAVIGDYNYVFNPTSYLKRFFADGVRHDYVFLMDEAHNLVDRGRQMYSETLVKEDILSCRKILKLVDKRLYNSLGTLNQAFLKWKKENPDFLKIYDIDPFMLKVLRVLGDFDRFFHKKIHYQGEDCVRDFYFKLRNFNNLLDYYDDHYLVYAERRDNNEYVLNLSCMDPSRILQERLDRARASVFFSATLLPLNYYRSLLCDVDDPIAVYADTVFKSDQMCIVNGVDITSKYTSRGDFTFDKYARYIYEIISARKGNYICFFPSYKFMNDILRFFYAYSSGCEIMVQKNDMKEEEKQDFLDAFHKKRDKSLVAFCVIGGLFSEGIDLTGDSLIGVIIAGAALPMVCRENELLKEYFDNDSKNGFDYAYLYPGMCKVLQAAGRLIRTEEDRGVIALLDERFSKSEYSFCFPNHWGEISRVNVNNVRDRIDSFWNED
ncbi:MAG: ATP-dependent DNA helicase [Lachnospiraceae bacterium]|nr:ATP-dependent DNA helicase [Lachnospiraceae bacterium]